ncbi:MAG TPA: NAD-glutamate dehydrogenase domain-containing protein [Acidimicrobiia bacterium]|nr:NAD-glutamate dehydrogenase domain-containing protein [Acidimicrobiia bacterium]
MTAGLEAALAEFAQAYIRRIPDQYVEALPDDVVFAEMRSVFDFLVIRRTDAVNVRVFNPSQADHGYDPGATVVDIVVDDSPFLVDSVHAAIAESGHTVTLDAHAVMAVQRDPEGRLIDVGHARSSDRRESIQHYVLDKALGDEERRTLHHRLEAVLGDVQAAVRDFEPMLNGAIERMIQLAGKGESRYGRDTVEEAVAFLQWLRELNFVFLGYREYDVVEVDGEPSLVSDPDSGLGILSDARQSSFAVPVPLSSLSDDLQQRYQEGFLLVVAKTNRRSTVHRPARMDYVGIREIGPDGSVVGEARLLGLFTSHALMAEASSIPILSGKLAAVLADEDLIEGSHDYRAAIRLFNSFPQADLWSMPVQAIKTAIEGLLLVESREHVRVFVSPDLLSRSVSLMVVLPKDRFSPSIRQRLQAYFLERFGGSSVDYQLSLGQEGTARIHFTVWIDGPVPDVPYDELERAVVEMSRTWEDRVGDHLQHLVDDAPALLRKWSPLLPEYYKTSTSLPVAAGDIRQLDALDSSEQSLAVGIQNDPGEVEGLTRVAVYTSDGRLELSRILPVLEAAGLQIIEEVPTRVGENGTGLFIHDVGVLGPDRRRLDVDACGSRLKACIEAGLAGLVEPDSLDRLVVLTGLTHEQVAILRTYRIYGRRVGSGFTEKYTNDILVAHPRISQLLVELFERRFDPSQDGADWGDIETELLALLDDVSSLEEDRILRGFFEMILATVRTNAYKPGRRAMSLKLWSAAVPGMPDPKPLYEIFVWAPEVEGIHLRGGRIARGGIRWSDRREDYRAEVLGLMKAQMTKNALIVATGAKGGFVLRGADDGTDPGVAMPRAYRIFVEGLLDLTDNLVGGDVVPPPHVRRHDPDDPYLVVAADRGTAALSDTANEISASYGFWLRDAFASGGSEGYDHKALGITAKGAWESVKRHFADMSIDVERTPITVAGIGDMSGDVFGNGMLRSPHAKLVAAFDHRHIILDPDPDPAAAFAERRRLYELPRSSWDDYDRSLISEGGGVWSRAAKRIDLSDEMRRVLQTEATSLTPDQLIGVILKAPVDLLWNGGIGTYVKARSETHAECLDRANDQVRVNGGELRCRVVGEGGNLGFTQRGRIEYAMSGGRINTDFIDNSGGVDCSDREVNLKILLGLAEEAGELDRDERAALVYAATRSVTDRVLEDNRDQAMVLSQDEEWSKSNLDAYEELMRTLERHDLLDRSLEALPGGEEMSERSREGRGLTRPELAVLLAYAKQDLKGAIIDSDIVDSPDLVDDLLAYFPDEASQRFAHLVWGHPLRREILATVLAGRVLNDQGITFVNRLVVETGANRASVVSACRAARQLVGADERWAMVEKLDPTVDPELTRDLLERIDWLVESVTRWYLAGDREVPDRDQLEADHRDFVELESHLRESQRHVWADDATAEIAVLTEAGVAEELARRHTHHDDLVHAPDIIELARAHRRGIAEIALLFGLIGRDYRLEWLERQVDQVTAASKWQKWAARSVMSDLISLRRELAERVLVSGEGLGVEEALEVYRRDRAERHTRLEEFMQSVAQEGTSSLDPLLVAARQIRALGA